MRPKENVPVARAERNLSRDILPRDVSSGFCRHEAGADGVAYEPRHIVDIQPVHQFAGCVSTVFTLSFNLLAMSFVEHPSATNCSTSRCCAVRSGSGRVFSFRWDR